MALRKLWTTKTLQQRSTVHITSLCVVERAHVNLFLAVYEKANTVGPLQSDVEQLVTVVVARASYEWRALHAGTVRASNLVA